MKSKEKLLNDISSLDIVKRSKELETLIDDNQELNNLLNERKNIAKEMTLTLHLNLNNTYNDYKKKYDLINDEISNYPLVEEYLDILDILHNDLKIMTGYIENKINSELN